jgi:glycosyltransferase involved in cell wall biosynthesis
MPRAQSGTPVVSVIVPARDARPTLGRTLEQLSRQELDADYEVIVVDDGSSDGTFELAAGFGDPVRAIRSSETQGPGAARNRGVQEARAELIAFTDADCFPTPRWLFEGLRAIDGADLIQGSVEPDPAANGRSRFDRTVVVRGEDGYYQTANMFVRRELFESLGGFEDFIVEGGGDGAFGWRAPVDGSRAEPAKRNVGEDTVFGWRARRAGARTGFAPDALVHHAVFPGTKGAWIRYQWWKRHMPGLAARIPELREELFFGRWFLDRRSASFDLALLGVAAAAASRRRAPLIAALPYAHQVYRDCSGRGLRSGASLAAASIAADAVTFGSLVAGSIAWRAPVF